LYSLLVVVLAVYFAGAFYNVRQAFRAYRALPYLEHRQINRHLRMQVLLTAPKPPANVTYRACSRLCYTSFSPNRGAVTHYPRFSILCIVTQGIEH
jgi:hypothetical protein